MEKVCAEEKQKQNLEHKMVMLEKDLSQSRHMLHRELVERAFGGDGGVESSSRGDGGDAGHGGDGYFQAAAVKVDRNIRRERNEEQEGLIMQKLSERASESLRELTTDLVVSAKSGMLLMILLNYREEDCGNIERALKSMFYRMRDYIGGFEGFEITIGLSPGITEFSKINLILEMSKNAAARRIFEGCGGCIEEYEKPSDPELLSENSGDIVADYAEKLRGSVSIFQAEEISNIVRECFEEAGRRGLSAGGYYRLAGELIETYVGIVAELFQVETEEAERWMEETAHCTSVNALRKHVKDVLKENLEALKKRQRDSERRPILSAIQYVQENFGKKILLEDIAEMSGFNATYFSEIFKKETGKNFTAFLLEVRIEASKAMLRDTTKTIYEIASEVGYKDPKFFSQQFTKIVGIKPKEYRRLYY